MRKVLEVQPALQQVIVRTAQEKHVKVHLLATVLVAYALEHIDDAIADAERLLEQWENREPEMPTLLTIHRLQPRKPNSNVGE